MAWLSQAAPEDALSVKKLAFQLAAMLESQHDTQITMMHVLEELQGQKQADRRMVTMLHLIAPYAKVWGWFRVGSSLGFRRKKPSYSSLIQNHKA